MAQPLESQEFGKLNQCYMCERIEVHYHVWYGRGGKFLSVYEKIILSMPQCVVSLERVFRVQTCVSGWLV